MYKDLEKPQRGLYYHNVKNFFYDSLQTNVIKIMILGETERSYKVKLLEPIRKHNAEDIIFVKKKNIRFVDSQL